MKDYLIKPIQRLCKYPLLLKSLSECTNEDAEDYPDIVSTLNKMNTTLQEINSMKDAQVSFTVLSNLTLRILEYPGTLLKFGRRFLRETRIAIIEKSVLTLEQNPNIKQLQQRAFSECPLTLLVFNDMLIFGREKKDKIQLKRQIPMVDVIVAENKNDDTSFFLHLPQESKTKYRNNMVFVEKSAERNLLFKLLKDLVKQSKASKCEKKADPIEGLATVSAKLFDAVSQSRVEIVNGLSHHSKIGEIVNMVSSSGESVLHIAAKKQDISVMMELLNIDGIDINAVDAEGSTPLHLTTDAEAIALLLVRGANQNILNKAGSPANEACALWCPHVLMEFEAKGAEGLYEMFPQIAGKAVPAHSPQQPHVQFARVSRPESPVPSKALSRGLSVGRPRNLSRRRDRTDNLSENHTPEKTVQEQPEENRLESIPADDVINSPRTPRLALNITKSAPISPDSVSPPSSPTMEKKQQALMKFRARVALQNPNLPVSDWDPNNLLQTVKETEIKRLTEENAQLQASILELTKKFEALSKLQDFCPCGETNETNQNR